VRKRRHAVGLTQEQAGAPLVTRAMISAIENGKILPGLRTLRQVAANLKTSIRALLPEDLPY
jgi:transcriptional regulator with XRE-family HTH domain